MEHKVSYYIQGVALNGDTCQGEIYRDTLHFYTEVREMGWVTQ